MNKFLLLFHIVCAVFVAGCDSQSGQSDSTIQDTESSADIDVVIPYDVKDKRGITVFCKSSSDCNDFDLCTGAVCIEGKCRYTQKSPVLEVREIPSVENAVDAAVASGYLYIANGKDGVDVYDIHSLSLFSPSHIGKAQTKGKALFVDALKNKFIAGEGDWGIETFLNTNLKKPSAALNVGKNGLKSLDEVVNVEMTENYFCISGYEKGLALLNNNMEKIGTVETPGRVIAAASYKKSSVFAADSLGGMVEINFKDGKPVAGGSISTNGRVVDLDVRGNTGIIAEYGAGVSLLDLSVADKPKRLVTVKRDTPAVAARLLGQQTGIVAYENGQIVIYDFINIKDPSDIISFHVNDINLTHRMDVTAGTGVVTLNSGKVAIFSTHCSK
jgi:hypothetical protein